MKIDEGKKNESRRHVRYGDVLEMHFGGRGGGGGKKKEETLETTFRNGRPFWRGGRERSKNFQWQFFFPSSFLFSFPSSKPLVRLKLKKKKKKKREKKREEKKAFDRVDGTRRAGMKNK